MYHKPAYRDISSDLIFKNFAKTHVTWSLQISTGEGKTLITALLSILHALAGKCVDIVTSSPVLAVQNVEEVAELFEYFEVKAGNNCDLVSSSSIFPAPLCGFRWGRLGLMRERLAELYMAWILSLTKRCTLMYFMSIHRKGVEIPHVCTSAHP